MSDLPHDPILERWQDLVRRLDAMERHLDELQELLKRYFELMRAMRAGDLGEPPPPPSPRVN